MFAFYLMFSIWHHRNKIKFDNGCPNTFAIIKYAQYEWNLWKDGFSLNAQETSSSFAKEMSVESWIPPPLGWIKLNFEAAFYQHRKKGAIAVVARNSEGRILGVAGHQIKANDVEEAEFRGVELAMQFALQKHMVDVILEGDNRSVIQTIVGDVQPAHIVAAKVWEVGSESFQEFSKDVLCIVLNLEANAITTK
ncbi:hypothetical protein FRX31_015316, partial [Thalictrum thalictroides]